MNLTLQEQETHLSMSADDRGTWHVYSDDPVMQRRLESIGAELVKVAADGIGKHYALPANQITFRKPPKPLSDERKAQLAEQLRRQSNPPVATDAKTVVMDAANGS